VSDRKLDFKTKMFYGVGSIAYGVKDNAFSFLLIPFYTAVLGLPGTLAGLAIFIALIFDAISDPVVGYASDNWRSRLGRRHPFMYLSAVPVAIAFFFLFNPPTELSDTALFAYLVILSILVRTFITFYEVPSSALAPELSHDYEERTVIFAYRFFFGWYGGLAMALLAYVVLLAPTEADPSGLTNEAGFRTYGMIAAVLMVSAILITCLGTHHTIKDLRKPPERTGVTLRQMLGEFVEAVAHPSFIALVISGILGAVGAGIISALDFFINGYFWQLSGPEIGVFLLGYFVSAALALLIAPAMGRLIGKKTFAVGLAIFAAFALPLPEMLRLFGLFPGPEYENLVWLLLPFRMVTICVVIMAGIMVASMISDVVEEQELRTTRRNEGVFFAARSFVQKASHGLGALVVGIAIDAIGFPRGAAPDQVPGEIVERIGMAYVPLIMFFYLSAALVLIFYRIDKARHTDNLAKLAERRRG